MIQKLHSSIPHDLLHAGNPVSERRIFETPRGTLFLQQFCPPSLVERLQADDGLRAFARRPELEYQLLLDLARCPECALALAYTESGEIVGQVTLAPADSWWRGLANTYEIAVEVSSNWRRLGVISHLLTFALELRTLERMILLAMGLCWHWDTADLDLSALRYRVLIARLFAVHNFAEYRTVEPNIQDDPANILLARIGKQVDQQTSSEFLSGLLQSSAVPAV